MDRVAQKAALEKRSLGMWTQRAIAIALLAIVRFARDCIPKSDRTVRMNLDIAVR